MALVITFILLLIFFFLAIIYFVSRKFNELKEAQKGDSGLQMLNQNLQILQSNVASALRETNSAINNRLDHSSEVISAFTKELGQIQQIGTQLKNFQEFLRSPKLRGNLGEQGLKELLSSGLPKKYYDLQYSFRNGTIVDAIINLESGKIPVDSKFPLENFNQVLKAETEDEKNFFRKKFKADFKNHINAIAKKYINPEEGTADFAFIFIPSESVFFEIINNEQELFEYASRNHIIVSSPSSFYYYLRTIMLGLEGRKITEMSKEILRTLKSIKNESAQFSETLALLNKHIVNSGKIMLQANNQYMKLYDKIESIDKLEKEERFLSDK